MESFTEVRNRAAQANGAATITAEELQAVHVVNSPNLFKQLPNSTAPVPRITILDLFAACSIGLLALIYTLPGIFIREYYRHTEADRTLIGWEMLERGNLILPRLLGDYYLTKPPVFYALLAASFRLFGPSEWAARLVTVTAVSLLLSALYLFYRLAGLERKISLLAVAIVGLCGQVFEYSVIAEIDLTYVFFCTFAVGSVYLSAVRRNGAPFIALSAIFLILAFFTKGPPVLVFYLSGVGGLLLIDFLSRKRAGSNTELVLKRSWIVSYGSVCLVLAGMIGLWLIQLSSAVGWPEVRSIFNNEVLVRFIQDIKAEERARGPFFYIGSVLRGLAPWILLLFGLCGKGREKVFEQFKRHQLFISFCCGVIVPSLIVFSCASGKSNRYLLPLYPFFAPMLAFCAAGIPAVLSLNAGRRILSAVLGCGVISVIAFTFYFHGLPMEQRLLSLVLLLSAGAGAAFYLGRRETVTWFGLAVTFAFLCITARYPFSVFFDGTRNRIYSIRPVAAEIEKEIPPGSPVYVAELFERWLPFYMKADGVQSLRLTPEIAGRLQNENGEIYLLLNADYESWRKDQLTAGGGTYTKVGSYPTAKDHFVLLRVPAKDAALLRPHKVFATAPSRPY